MVTMFGLTTTVCVLSVLARRGAQPAMEALTTDQGQETAVRMLPPVASLHPRPVGAPGGQSACSPSGRQGTCMLHSHREQTEISQDPATCPSSREVEMALEGRTGVSGE